MKYVVMSISDKAVGSYMRPMFVRSVGEGIRLFTDEINRNAADNVMYAHPGDYDLYHLCYFDDEDGEFCDEEKNFPELVARGDQVKVRSGA